MSLNAAKCVMRGIQESPGTDQYFSALIWRCSTRFAQNHGPVHPLNQVFLCRRQWAIFFQAHLLQRTLVDFFTLLTSQFFGLLWIHHLESISLDSRIFGQYLFLFLFHPQVLCLTQRFNFGTHCRRSLPCLRRADRKLLDHLHNVLCIKEIHLVLHYSFANRQDRRLALRGQRILCSDT